MTRVMRCHQTYLRVLLAVPAVAPSCCCCCLRLAPLPLPVAAGGRPPDTEDLKIKHTHLLSLLHTRHLFYPKPSC